MSSVSVSVEKSCSCATHSCDGETVFHLPVTSVEASGAANDGGASAGLYSAG